MLRLLLFFNRQSRRGISTLVVDKIRQFSYHPTRCWEKPTKKGGGNCEKPEGFTRGSRSDPAAIGGFVRHFPVCDHGIRGVSKISNIFNGKKDFNNPPLFSG
jgi:hypothetical protein